MRHPRHGSSLLLAGPVLLGLAGPAYAQETVDFLGAKIKAHESTYVVTKDVNVRAEPKTKSKRVGRLKRGERIEVVGRAPGAWVATRRDGADFGFVYEPILLPLIDGSLDKVLEGRVTGKGGVACKYKVSFEGKSSAQGQLFEIFDYDVAWACTRGKAKIAFHTPMFITEGPYQLNQRARFQISVDIPELDAEVEEVFSTTVIYDREKTEIRFDGVSTKALAGAPAAKTLAVFSVAKALTGAVGMASSAWNKKVWDILLTRTQ